MSAAAKHTSLAVVSAGLLGAVLLAGVAGGAWDRNDRIPPTEPANVHVTEATPSKVGVAWDPAQDNMGVAGYYVYEGNTRARVTRTWYTLRGLACGQSTTIDVVAFDKAGNRSQKVSATVATAACPDVSPPTSPSDFQQTATTQTGVVLTWAPSSDDVGVVGYGVYQGLLSIGFPSEPSVALSGLTCGTSYSYGVDAVDAAGNRSPIATAFVQTADCTDSQPPTTPGTPSVTATTQTSASLAWSASSDDVGVMGYGVYVDGVSAASVTQPSGTVSGLACGTSYTLAVDAFDAAGNRSQRSSTSATTAACSTPPPLDTEPPATPVLSSGSITQTSAVLNWEPGVDNVGVDHYNVWLGSSMVDQTTALTYTFSDLSCDTDYLLGLEAVDAAGNTSVLAEARSSVRTLACSSPPPPPGDTSPPSQPGSLAVSGSSVTSVSLTWAASSDNVGVAGYGVYRNGSGVSTVNQPGATVSGLVCGTAYTFEVDAFDAAGNRSTRASLVASTAACADTQPPTTPANVVVTSRTATSIALSWSASTDNVGVVGYGLYRAATQTGTSATTSAIFSGLTCDTSYTLSVDAYDAAGNRSQKTAVLASTTACADTSPPSQPGNLAASNVSETALTLTWSASTDNVGVTGYDVYRDSTKMATVTSTSSSQTGLACGTSYAFAVVARDSAGNSSQAAQVTASTTSCSSSPPPASTITAGETSVLPLPDTGNGNLLVAQQATVGQDSVLQTLSFYVTTAAGKLRLGVYDSSGPGGGPGAKIAETSEFTPVAGWNTVAVTAAVPVAAGNYWLAYHPSSSSLAFRAEGSGLARYYPYSYGALPATFSSSPSSEAVHWSFYATLGVSGSSTPPPTPPPSTGTSPTLEQVDGGSGYYGQFSKALPTSPNFFPIAVWGAYNHTQANRDLDAAAGINVYVWAADNSYMDDIRADGRFRVIQDEGNQTNVGSETAGWLLADEIDMCCGPPGYAGGNGYNMLDSILAGLPQDGSMRYTNYGKGVLLWESDADAARFINGRNGPNSYQQLVSADLYWFTDPNERSGSRYGYGSSYGDDVRRMRYLDSLDGARMPVWAFVEAGWPFTESASAGGRKILPAELRSAVWHSLIGGARGIIYFQHSFGGPCIGDHHVIRSNCEGTRPMVTSVDAQIASLAPVLNSPSATSGHSATDTMSGTVRYMVKWANGKFWVFAGADRGAGDATFSIPCVGNATAVVEGENRSLPVSNGSFTDQFADKNAVHIYRIDGGSSCGLS